MSFLIRDNKDETFFNQICYNNIYFEFLYNATTSISIFDKPFVNFIRFFTFNHDVLQTTFMVKNKKINPTDDTHAIVILIYAICIVKIKNNKIVLLILFIMFNARIRFTRAQKELYLNNLKKCFKLDFFTIESIQTIDDVKNIFDQELYSSLVFSKMKYRRNSHYENLILMLSGDIESQPGPRFSCSNTCDLCKLVVGRGIHLIHLNVNSLLPKIDEVRKIAKCSNASVLGITETKLDQSIHNEEISIDGYNLIRKDRNRHGGGVACFV